ncbi:MAG: hypothetical protein QW594_00860 [Candidatus Woesearchaeota archaeon]
MNPLDHLIEKRMQEKNAKYKKRKYLTTVLLILGMGMVFLLLVFLLTFTNTQECQKVTQGHLSKINAWYNNGRITEEQVHQLLNAYYDNSCLSEELAKILSQAS